MPATSPSDDASVRRLALVPKPEKRPSPKRPRLLAWLLLLAPVVIVLAYPFAQNYIRALSLMTRVANPEAKGWIANYEVHPVDVHDGSFEFQGRRIPAHLYTPRGVASAPGIVVLHGMHDLGINEPRLISFARVLASSGYYVMTPMLPGLADYRLEAESAALIGEAARSLSHELGVPKVGLLGVSFSGGLALLAASEPQSNGSIAWVASLGGHYDLAHVMRFLATGEALRPDGTIERLSPHEYGSLIVIYDRPEEIFSASDVSSARKAIRLLLSSREKESEALTARMSPADQQIMQRIYHKQRESFAPAILSTIDRRRDQIALASPAGHLASLHVPVLLLHGSDDSIIPATELLWLQRDIPEPYMVNALVSPAITHVEVGGPVGWRDRLALVHWLSLLIRQIRNTPTSQLGALPAGTWLPLPTTH